MHTLNAVETASRNGALGSSRAGYRKRGRDSATTAMATIAAACTLLLGMQSAGAQPTIDTGATVSYMTVAGDTLYEVAQRYLTDAKGWRALALLNHVRAPRRLPAGMKLRLPVALLRRDSTAAHIVALSGMVTARLSASSARAEAPPEMPLWPRHVLGENASERFADEF